MIQPELVEAFITLLQPNERGCWVCPGAPKYGSFYWNHRRYTPSHLAWELSTNESHSDAAWRKLRGY